MRKQDLPYQYCEPKHEDGKKKGTYTPKTFLNMEIIHKTYEEVRGHDNHRPISVQPLALPKTSMIQRFSEHGGMKRSTPRKEEAHTQFHDENGNSVGMVPTPHYRGGQAARPDFHRISKGQPCMPPNQIEKVSAQASYSHGLQAPPRQSFEYATPTFNTMACVTSQPPVVTEQKKTAHRHTKSASKKIVEYIQSSADFLDETRRDIAGKFSPQFNPSFDLHAPFSLGHRKNSVSSLESFYCAGEAVPYVEQPTRCRLCRSGVEGPRGLCMDCEEDHRRPSSSLPSLKSDRGSFEGRPTPPPKDHKYLSTAGEELKRPSTAERYVEEMRLGYVASQQKVITPMPSRQQSMKVAILDGGGEDTSNDMSNWATVCGSSEFEYFERLEPVKPLKITRKAPETPARDTKFYSFYDELL